MKFMLLVKPKQLFHLFMILQGTREMDLKARRTIIESVYNQRFDQPLLCAISIAIITPDNSTNKYDSTPKLCAKQPRQSDSLFLKIPPQAACQGVPAATLSILHLVQFKRGGCQITSIISGALGG